MCVSKKITAYTIKSQLKNYFIHYYIETFLLRSNFFDILLVFVSFLQTLQYLFFPYSLLLFFSSSDKFLYLSLACSLNLFYHFHNNLLLYLILCLGFFYNKLNQHSHPFLYNKKIIKHPFYQLN